MREYIALDSHKHYSLAEREAVRSGRVRQARIEHRPGAIRAYLSDASPGTPVAGAKVWRSQALIIGAGWEILETRSDDAAKSAVPALLVG